MKIKVKRKVRGLHSLKIRIKSKKGLSMKLTIKVLIDFLNLGKKLLFIQRDLIYVNLGKDWGEFSGSSLFNKIVSNLRLKNKK